MDRATYYARALSRKDPARPLRLLPPGAPRGRALFGMRTSEAFEDQVVMMTDHRLRAGAFYLVIRTFDPNAELWENERVPARFAGYVGGERTWSFLGKDGVSDWPVGWVGPEIVP